MTGHGQQFGRKKELAIAALLAQRTVDEAAKAAGVSLTTLKRWMKLPEFRAEYLVVRREAVLQAHARLQQNSGAAASVLLRLMADPQTPASVRARAAECVLERAGKTLELDDLELRVARLEEADEKQGSNQ